MTIKETFDYLKNIQDFSDIKLICIKEIPRVCSGYFIIHSEKNCIHCNSNKPCESIGLKEWYKTGYFPINVGDELTIDYINDTSMRLLDGEDLSGTWDINVERNKIGEFKIVNKF